MTIAQLAERNGIKPDTMRKRWNRLHPSVPFSVNAEITEQQAAELLNVPARKSAPVPSRVPRVRSANLSASVPSVAESVPPIPFSVPPEIRAEQNTESTADFRVIMCRWLLWLITAAHMMLVLVGAFIRFDGLLGLFVAFIPCAFIVASNIAATDSRFWETTENAKFSAFVLYCAFGYLDFLTFREVVDLPSAESRFWFSVSASVLLGMVAFSALVFQQKMSVEK